MSNSTGSPSAGPRPRQVTLAACFAVVGSALLVLSVFDTMNKLHSVEMRDRITEALASGANSGLGITVTEVLSLMRIGLLVTGAAGAASVVLGVYVFQRHRAARVVLTILAVPVVLSTPFWGGFYSAFVAAAVAMLWTKPSRDWFAGRAPAPAPNTPGITAMTQDPPGPPQDRPGQPDRPEQPEASDQPESSGQPEPSGQPGEQPPPATNPYGAPPPSQSQPQQGSPYPEGQYPPPGGQYPPPQGQYPPPQGGPYPPQQYPAGQQPPYGSQPYGAQPYGTQPYGGGPVDPDRRPGTVTGACVLTWLVSGLTIVLLGLTGIAISFADRADLRDAINQDQAMRDANITLDDLVAVMWVVLVIGIAWALIAMLLAVFAFRRKNWARIVLVVSASIAGLATMVMGIAFFGFWVVTASAVATVIMLFTSGAQEWYARSSGQRPPSFQPPQPGSDSTGGGSSAGGPKPPVW